MTRPEPREAHHVQSLARGLAVIRSFEAANAELTMSDVAGAAGWPKLRGGGIRSAAVVTLPLLDTACCVGLDLQQLPEFVRHLLGSPVTPVRTPTADSL